MENSNTPRIVSSETQIQSENQNNNDNNGESSSQTTTTTDNVPRERLPATKFSLRRVNVQQPHQNEQQRHNAFPLNTSVQTEDDNESNTSTNMSVSVDSFFSARSSPQDDDDEERRNV